jgi:hypothetical protein
MEFAQDGSSTARFFDDKNQDRGWAKKVTKRTKAIGRLTVLDVVTTETALASFLTGLDRGALRVQCTDFSGASYRFEWASGYENGSQIRIQGVLADVGLDGETRKSLG